MAPFLILGPMILRENIGDSFQDFQPMATTGLRANEMKAIFRLASYLPSQSETFPLNATFCCAGSEEAGFTSGRLAEAAPLVAIATVLR